MVMRLFTALVVCGVAVPLQACFVGGSFGAASRIAQTLIRGGAPRVSAVAKMQRSHEHTTKPIPEKIRRPLHAIEKWSNEMIGASVRLRGYKSHAFEERPSVCMASDNPLGLDLLAYEEGDLNDYDDNRAIVAECERVIITELMHKHNDNMQAAGEEFERLLGTIYMTPAQLNEQMELAMRISHHYQSMHMQQKTQQLLKDLNGRLDRLESKLSTMQKTHTSSQDELFKMLREHSKQCSHTSMQRLRYWEMEKE